MGIASPETTIYAALAAESLVADLTETALIVVPLYTVTASDRARTLEVCRGTYAVAAGQVYAKCQGQLPHLTEARPFWFLKHAPPEVCLRFRFRSCIDKLSECRQFVLQFICCETTVTPFPPQGFNETFQVVWRINGIVYHRTGQAFTLPCWVGIIAPNHSRLSGHV